MTRKEFEDWLDHNNFRTVYDTSYESYRYCNGIQDPFQIGTFGCYESNSKWYVQSYQGALGDRPSTNYCLSHSNSLNTEEEALEILKSKILEYEHNTICASYKENVKAFIEEIRGKKIQNYFTYENSDYDLTRQDVDILISKYFKDCNYGFTEDNEQILYIIHNKTHRPILYIKVYNPTVPRIDYTIYIPIIYQYMNKKIIFFSDIEYELSYSLRDFEIDKTGLYLLDTESIKKYDFNGKLLWNKEVKFNSIKVRFATNRDLSNKEYDDKRYIGIIDIEKLYIIPRENSNNDVSSDSDKIINAECFACKTKFRINCRNIPSNQKKFYWKCSKCNTELKIGNPSYFENSKNENLIDRESLTKSIQLSSNIRSLSKKEQNEEILKNITKVNEILKNIQCDNSEYELSKRQQATKNNAMTNIKTKDYLQAYYEIVDFIENYGDNPNGKVYLTEKQEIYNLINMLYNEIKG